MLCMHIRSPTTIMTSSEVEVYLLFLTCSLGLLVSEGNWNEPWQYYYSVYATPDLETQSRIIEIPEIQNFTEESIAERDQETLINRKDFVGLVLDLTKGLFVRLLAFWFSAQPKACILVILLLFQEYINITRNNICIKTLFIHTWKFILNKKIYTCYLVLGGT